MKDSAVRPLRHQAASDEAPHGDLTWRAALMSLRSQLHGKLYIAQGTANTVGGAVNGFPSQLSAVRHRFRGFQPAPLILRPSIVQAGVVTTNVAALYLVSKSTDSCLSCWDFHRAGDSVSSVHLFGQFLAPATFMLGLDLTLTVVGIVLLGPAMRGMSLVRGLNGGALTLIWSSLTAGVLEFKALAALSPIPREGSSWKDPLTLHLLMINVVVLIISLVIGAYFARPATGSLTSIPQEFPDYSGSVDQ
jgi:hypothetical protein